MSIEKLLQSRSLANGSAMPVASSTGTEPWLIASNSRRLQQPWPAGASANHASAMLGASTGGASAPPSVRLAEAARLVSAQRSHGRMPELQQPCRVPVHSCPVKKKGARLSLTLSAADADSASAAPRRIHVCGTAMSTPSRQPEAVAASSVP